MDCGKGKFELKGGMHLGYLWKYSGHYEKRAKVRSNQMG
jgi:hypothetical protein